MKPTILLLHGALNTSDQFTLLTEKLEPFFDIYSFDFSGHSQEQYKEVLDMSVLVRYIEQYMERFAV